MKSQTSETWKPTTSPPNFPLELTKKTSVSPAVSDNFRRRLSAQPTSDCPGPVTLSGACGREPSSAPEQPWVSLFLFFELQNLKTGGLNADDGR